MELELKKIRGQSSFLNSVGALDISRKDLITAMKKQDFGRKNTLGLFLSAQLFINVN